MCTYARCAGSMWMGLLNDCLQYDYSSKLRQLQDLIAVEQRHWLFGGSDKSVLEWVTCIAQYGTSLQQSKSPDVEYRAARRDNYMRINYERDCSYNHDTTIARSNSTNGRVWYAVQTDGLTDRRTSTPQQATSTLHPATSLPVQPHACQCYERATI